MRKTFAIAAMMAVSVFIFCGCGNSARTPDDKTLIARINNYEMTVSDFKDEASLTLASKRIYSNADKAKEELLDEMITKQVLLQEAQRQNFDKDRAFMKEIERYWEQALLKLLFNKKARALMAGIEISEEEVKEEYGRESAENPRIGPYEKEASGIRSYLGQKKVQEALDAWIMELKAKSNIKIYKNVLKETNVD